MKKLLIVLSIIATVAFSACGGGADAKAKLFSDYEALMEKTYDIAKKVEAGDAEAMAEFATIQEEATKFMEDNKEALSKLTAEDQAEFAKIATKFINK